MIEYKLEPHCKKITLSFLSYYISPSVGWNVSKSNHWLSQISYVSLFWIHIFIYNWVFSEWYKTLAFFSKSNAVWNFPINCKNLESCALRAFKIYERVNCKVFSSFKISVLLLFPGLRQWWVVKNFLETRKWCSIKQTRLIWDQVWLLLWWMGFYILLENGEKVKENFNRK